MDKISLFLICLIIILSTYVVGVTVINNINSCTSNPLVYGAQKFEKEYGNPFYGSGNFVDIKNHTFLIEFNSTSIKEIDPTAPSRDTRMVAILTPEQIEKLLSNISVEK